jgi:hypothetical protein
MFSNSINQIIGSKTVSERAEATDAELQRKDSVDDLKADQLPPSKLSQSQNNHKGPFRMIKIQCLIAGELSSKTSM